jgi:hypothetical protein
MGKNILKKLILPLALTFSISQNTNNFNMKNNYVYKIDKNGISIDHELTSKKDFYISSIKSLSDFSEKVKYSMFPESFSKDYWQNPEETKMTLEGNCISKSILMNDTLSKNGLEIYLVYGLRKKGDKYSHAWNEFVIGKDTFIVESSNRLHIYQKSKLLGLNKGYFYSPSTDTKKMDYLTKHVSEYEKRNNIKLNFPQIPSQQHSSL